MRGSGRRPEQKPWPEPNFGQSQPQGRAVRGRRLPALALGRILANDIRQKSLYFDQRQAMDANRREFQAKIRQAGENWKHEFDYREARNWS